MSIIFANETGWILDEQRWYERNYEESGYRIPPTLYQIDEPFRMDSQVEVINRRRLESAATPEETSTVEQHQGGRVKESAAARRNRRKRSHAASAANNADDESVRTIIRSFEKLIADARDTAAYFDPSTSTVDRPLTNNRAARTAAKEAEDRAPRFPTELRPISTASSESKEDVIVENGGRFRHLDELVGKTCSNRTARSIALEIGPEGDQSGYVMPANSRFALGDMERELERILGRGKSHDSALVRGFTSDPPWESGYTSFEPVDLLIMDPPWQNKSVKRQKTYSTQSESDLARLPIRDLLKPGGIAAIWVTNNPHYLEYLVDILLPTWELVLEARWFWFKTTTTGEPVCEYKRGFKAPFESVVFARRSPSSTLEEPKKAIPDGKLIVSVPSASPSRKPPLLDILGRFISTTKNRMSCMELYARYLMPDTFSVGDQVIKFQSLQYFEHV